MSNMSNLDIVLTAHKLSGAQKNAVVELLSEGFTTAMPNTIKSLENKGLIKLSDGWELEESFKAELKAAYSQPEPREEESVESLLQGDPWKVGDAITADEADIVLESEAVYDAADPNAIKSAQGFTIALDWRGTEVWNGLTAQQIREDIETASPVNRKARRTHFRTLRNAFRRQTVQRPRKALKITGKVGV